MTPEDERLWNEVPAAPLHWDRLGVPISLREWAELLGDDTYRRIASDDIGGLWVSTVWIGISSSFEPYVFETAVFEPDGSIVEQDRYTTEAAARDGHAAIVARLTGQTVNSRPVLDRHTSG